MLIMDNVDEGLLTMSNPEDRPEIAKLKNDVNIPCALVQKVRARDHSHCQITSCLQKMAASNSLLPVCMGSLLQMLSSPDTD